MTRPRRPLHLEPRAFDAFEGAVDPALRLQLAHDSAGALLARVRVAADPETVARVLAYTREHGVAELAEMWADAPAHSLPGALWRLWVIHASIVSDPETTAHAFRRGVDDLDTIDEVVAGARRPTGPDDIRDLADDILRGAFTGDLADALERAAAYCRIEAHGITTLIGAAEIGSSALLERAVVLADFARDFHACAGLARTGRLI
jgi:hypothetical protein